MKSSSMTFIFKYFFPFAMLSMGMIGTYLLFTSNDNELHGFAKAFTVAVLWTAYFFVQMPFRLKFIEATESGIILLDSNKKLIEYKDIIWLTKFDITSPFFVTIKYKDRISGMTKKIAFMPNQMENRMNSNDPLTTFIKNKMKEIKLNYSQETEPSPMKNLIILMLLSIPMTLLMIYFLNETFNFI